MMIPSFAAQTEIPDGLGWLGTAGDYNPNTNTLDAGCIGCPEGEGGGGGASDPYAACDPVKVAAGYSCLIAPDGTISYQQPVRGTTGNTSGVPVGGGTGTTGSGPGSGAGNCPSGHCDKPTSTLGWILLGAIAFLGVGVVMRARK